MEWTEEYSVQHYSTHSATEHMDALFRLIEMKHLTSLIRALHDDA